MLIDSKKATLINQLYPIQSLLDVSDYKYQIVCPFHNDTAPSAHVYENKMWCFGKCHRFWYPMNIIQKFKLDANKLYNELIEEYGEEKLEELFREFQSKKISRQEHLSAKKTSNETFKEFSERYFSK